MYYYKYARSPLQLKCSDLLLLSDSSVASTTPFQSSLAGVHDARIVTKATAIQFINGKCHIKKQKGHKTTLSGYYTCVSHDLLLVPLGSDTHTCKRANVRECNDFKKPGVWVCGHCAPGLTS